MASEPVAHSESFTIFIPELERLITEMMEEWKVPGLAVAVVQNGGWRSSSLMAFAMSKPA
jgi:CubicO group peptidase (beta-lactamase class C family)